MRTDIFELMDVDNQNYQCRRKLNISLNPLYGNLDRSTLFLININIVCKVIIKSCSLLRVETVNNKY